MTQVRIWVDDEDEPWGVSAQGHSRCGSPEHDPVCASLSTLFEVLAEGVRGMPESAVRWERDPDQPRWSVGVDPAAVSKADWRVYRRFLRAALRVLDTLADRYPEHCSVRRVQTEPGIR